MPVTSNALQNYSWPHQHLNPSLHHYSQLETVTPGYSLNSIVDQTFMLIASTREL